MEVFTYVLGAHEGAYGALPPATVSNTTPPAHARRRCAPPRANYLRRRLSDVGERKKNVYHDNFFALTFCFSKISKAATNWFKAPFETTS